MAAQPQDYLAVLKAAYDYDPQPDADDEIAVKENQLLYLLERVDDDWWKVKIKGETQEEDGLSGLVPSAYVEPAEHISVVKALYDYEAAQPGELSVSEDEILYVYDKDDDWILVHSQKEGGKIGYVPGNYVEEVSANNEPTAAAAPSGLDLSKLVIPDSPPKPAYTDPAELVNRSKAKAQPGPVETWSVSEVDKKGKKKKGTLGVGNGAMFFASESDKTPVQKWQTSDINATRLEKSKHVHVDIGGSSPISLHFHVGSKEIAEAIMAKLDLGREPEEEETPAPPPAPESPPERPRSSAQKSVHFDASEPEIIPLSDDEGPEPDEASTHTYEASEGERAVVLYDFQADGEDEMSVNEGETLLVLERDTDEWWKCRNGHGEEGVVPANYLELVPGSGPPVPSVAAEEDARARAAREAEERAEEERREREEKDRKEKERKKEAEQRAKAAAAAAEADRKRREQEREKQREKEKESERSVAEEARRQKAAQRESSGSIKDKRPNGESGPAPEKTRVWHDRTGQFRVEAAFLGFTGGKLRLHKVNGVVIEVPSEKMSADDMRYVEKVLSKQQAPTSSPRRTSDDEPLELRRRSLQPTAKPTPKKGLTVDWFEFFLNAGCDVDDCSRYAQSFERDKIDEAILPDITESTMRSLGLREGDIIRVKKAIEQRSSKSSSPSNDAKAEQLRRDEELARQLQAEESGGSRGQAPNLFAAGPNGALKNSVRRGRPQPSKSLPPAMVDLQSINSASDHIGRAGTPLANSPARSGSTPIPPQPSGSTSAPNPAPATTPKSGFDDDAWTVRPSSTKPIAPSSPANTRSASVPPVAAAPAPPPAPPAPTTPAAPAPPAPPSSAPPGPQAAPQHPAATGLANKTESDIFEQLARLSALRTQSPAINQRPASLSPPVVSPPPMGYQTGMGMGNSSGTMAQHLQAQQTGMLPPPQSLNGPRGPLAPIPVNQSLLQPLVPTTTGFNSFVPTRPSNASSPFQPSPSPSFLNTQPTGFMGAQQPMMSQPTGFQPQPTGFQPQPTGFQPQPTGFQPQSMMSQPTGFQSSGPMMAQPTGMGGNFGGSMGNMGGMGSLPPLQTSGFGGIQSNPTGFNSGFGQFNTTSPPPPTPPPAAVSTNPANVFAQMKSGAFGQEDNGQSQNPDKYDALRPNSVPLNPQMTGWNGGYQGMTGFTGGYGYQR